MWRLFKTSVSGFGRGVAAATFWLWLGVLAGDFALLSLRSAGWSLVAHGVAGFLLVMIVVGLGFGDPREWRAQDKNATTESEMALLLIALAGSAALFGLMCRDLLLMGGAGFTGLPPVASRWTWMAYGIDNLLECGLFDLPSVYEFQLTKIKPSNFWTQTFVMAYRLMVDYILVVALLRYLRSLSVRRGLDRAKLEGRGT